MTNENPQAPASIVAMARLAARTGIPKGGVCALLAAWQDRQLAKRLT